MDIKAKARLLHAVNEPTHFNEVVAQFLIQAGCGHQDTLDRCIEDLKRFYSPKNFQIAEKEMSTLSSRKGEIAAAGLDSRDSLAACMDRLGFTDNTADMLLQVAYFCYLCTRKG